MSRTVAAQIAETLRSRIDAGEWAGNRLPPERSLALDFGVARNTVRRAIALLKQERTIAGRVGRGTFVVNGTGTVSGIVERIQGSSPADVMEIRLMLEPSTAAFAATQASASELAAVGDAHRRAIASPDMPGFEHWDAEFHHRIVACSRNDLLRQVHDLLKTLRNQTPWFEMKRRSFSEETRQSYCAQHAFILETLNRRDPEAARDAMLAHLLAVRFNLLGR